MRNRVALRQIVKLSGIHRAMKVQAQDLLAVAREAELVAIDAERTACREMDIAHGEWLDCLARPGFAPEYSSALATRLIAREAEAQGARAQCGLAADAHLRQQDAWRLAEARERASRDNVRNAKRNAARHREDKRLDALADRVTHDWMLS